MEIRFDAVSACGFGNLAFCGIVEVVDFGDGDSCVNKNVNGDSVWFNYYAFCVVL